MKHIGIDLGGSESQVCIREASGAIVHEGRIATHALHEALSSSPPSRVVLETCAEAFAVAERLRARGHDVRVVPARLVRQLGVGARGIKTDVRDARALSEVSCKVELPSVHVPSAESRDVRTSASLRDALVRSRTLLINTVRGYSRTRLIQIRRGSKTTFPRRVREALLAHEHGLPASIERQLVVIETLTEQIRAADAELKAIAEQSSTCRLLMSTPGVGPLTSIFFSTVIDDVDRFASAQLVQSYLGLTPGEDSSSKRISRTSITKAGPSSVRRVLVQAAWAAWRRAPNDPIVLWAKQVAGRRGPKVAIIALARKLAGVMFAIWRDKTPYDAKLAARPSVS